MKYKKHQNTELQFAFSSLHDFFDSYSLNDAIKLLKQVVKASTAKKEWNKGSPSDLMYFTEQIHGLCGTVYLISATISDSENYVLPILTPSKDLRCLKNGRFISGNHFATVWNCFPRHLKLEEFCNPFLVLKKFMVHGSKEEWQKTIRELTFFALSRDSSDDEYTASEILKNQKILLELLEACHLLHVRDTETP